MARKVKVKFKSKGKTVSFAAKIHGKSNLKYDKRCHAKHPGKRKSKRGKTYSESRRNRSDVGKWL